MKSLHLLILSFALLLGIAGGCAGSHAEDATNSLPVATPMDGSTVTLQLPPNLSPWLMLIPLLVPGVVAMAKGFFPQIPPKWLPVLAFLHGPVLVLLDKLTGFAGHNPVAVVTLGVAGVGIREIWDQWKPDNSGVSLVPANAAGPRPGERGHVQFKVMVLVAGLTALLALCAGCQAVTQHGNIVSVTQSVVGIDLSQDASSASPHLRLGYVRSQFHVIPTAKGTNSISAPAVAASMSLDNTFGHQVIDEDFSTGAAALTPVTNSPAAISAKGRANKAAPHASTNAVPLLTPPGAKAVTHTNELYLAPEPEATAKTNAPAAK